MPLAVTFGYTLDEPRVVNKSFSGTNVQMLPNNDVNVLSPEFIIEYNSSLADVNYAWIQEFKRYYFVKVAVLPNKRMRFNLVVDVLMSNSVKLLATEFTIIRTGDLPHPTYVNDPNFPLEPHRKNGWRKNFQFCPHTDGQYTGIHLVIHTL